eukprot:CAMPEP_0117445516 /NCGR_PEP_ID=MMETSP0759-20121206/5838_1 /TAXON_ID=63605 /ORGANISM="Percolomonas cosmopolitus, Strain WS" /LENGTH=1526 /DNA_ID=CAMNT_0005237699 /DNA_START=179 /DNA_END=4759 /DNA_ORIENTATION=+
MSKKSSRDTTSSGTTTTRMLPNAQTTGRIVHQHASSYIASLYCGTGREGVLNASFDSSEFNHPTNVLCLPDGLILVSDQNNNKLRVLNVRTQKVADFCPKARLLRPTGLCLWNQNTVLVCDTGHNRIKQISLKSPDKCSYFAEKKGPQDGKLKEAQFNEPTDVCVAPDGAILVADSGNHRIRRIVPSSNKVLTVAGSVEGYKDGPSREAQFRRPSALQIDFDGGVLVCDTKNNSIRKISRDFHSAFTIAGGSMNKGKMIDGSATECSFFKPRGIAIASNGDIIVADTGNNCIRRIADGKVSTFAGGSERTRDDTILSMKGNAGFRDGPAAQSIFNAPRGIVCLRDEAQDVFLVADSNNNVVRMMFPSEDDILASTLQTTSSRASSPAQMTSSRSSTHRLGGSISTPASPTQRSMGSRQSIAKLTKETLSETDALRKSTSFVSSMAEIRENFSRQANSTVDALYRSADTSADDNTDSPKAPHTYYELIYQHEDELSRIFAFYCNANSSKYESNTLSAVKFMRFVRDCKLLDAVKLNSSSVFIIFFEVTKHSNMRMSFNDFVNGMCMVARKKFSAPKTGAQSLLNTSALGEADEMETKQLLRTLLYQYVLPNARKSSLDPSMDALSDQEVYNVWSKHERALYKIFSYYASSTHTNYERQSWKNAQKGLHTLNIEEFYKFCKDFDIFPQFTSKQKLTTIFRSSASHANHFDHDPSEESNTGDSASSPGSSTDPVVALDFYCFLECLGRIAIMRFSEDDLNKSYPTTANKIEALLEHMHLSQGRELFASTMGSRLFRGLHSPRQKELHKETKKKKSDPSEYNLNYAKYSKEKKQKKGRFAGILNHAVHTSQQNRSFTPGSTTSSNGSQFDGNSSTGSYLANHLTKTDRDIQYKSTSMERVLCTAENITLFTFDPKRKYWKYLCTGNMKIVNNPSFLIPLKRPFLIRFAERETNTELVNVICTENLPYVDHEELFHIWKKGSGGKTQQLGLFPDGRIYGVQFPSAESSKAFENQYAKISKYEGSMKGSLDENRVVRYDFMNLTRRHAQTMDVLYPVSASPLSPSNRGARAGEFDSSSLRNSFEKKRPSSSGDASSAGMSMTKRKNRPELSNLIVSSPSNGPRQSPLTKSMLISPKVTYSPSGSRQPQNFSFKASDVEPLNNSTISNLPQTPDRSYTYSPRNDTQFGSEDASMMNPPDIQPVKQSQGADSSRVQQQQKRFDLQDMIEYEHTLNKLITDYFSSFENICQVKTSDLSNGIKKRIKWATGLKLSAACDMFQEEGEETPQPASDEPRTMQDVRRTSVASSLVCLDSSICCNFQTLRQYYDTIHRTLPRENVVVECYLKDSLGMKMFTHMPTEAFSVVLDDMGHLTMHVVDNGELFSSKQKSRDLLRANVTVTAAHTGRRTVSQDLSVVFDETRPSVFITVPFIVASEDQPNDDDELVLCLQDFQPQVGPIYESSVKVEMEFVIRVHGVAKKRLITFDLSLGTFENRTLADRVYVSMKESRLTSQAALPDVLKPLSLFGFRTLTQLE